MTHEITIAGFGGQGILLMGQLLAEAALLENKQVSWIPSYGQEMRGGTATCSVIISDERIGSPLIDHPTMLVTMNLPSLTRFEPTVCPGGVILLNSTLVNEDPKRTDVKVYKVPMNDIAAKINKQALNVVGLGCIVALSKAVGKASALKASDKTFGKKFADKPQLLASNKEAFEAGFTSV
jgi:2-oxoglutarate ferredoxin oxidoreductase subunit gamma